MPLGSVFRYVILLLLRFPLWKSWSLRKLSVSRSNTVQLCRAPAAVTCSNAVQVCRAPAAVVLAEALENSSCTPSAQKCNIWAYYTATSMLLSEGVWDIPNAVDASRRRYSGMLYRHDCVLALESSHRSHEVQMPCSCKIRVRLLSLTSWCKQSLSTSKPRIAGGAQLARSYGVYSAHESARFDFAARVHISRQRKTSMLRVGDRSRLSACRSRVG